MIAFYAIVAGVIVGADVLFSALLEKISDWRFARCFERWERENDPGT